MQSISPTTIMDRRVLCPSLPDLLRKTILTFCEGSVKFQRTLEVIGSIHICSDSEKIATFLLDEQVTRPSVRGDEHASDSVSKVTSNETYPSHNGIHQTSLENGGKSGSSNGELMLPPKKSRKTLKPVRKLNYRYVQNLESSDAESDNEYITVDSNGRDSQGLQPGKDYVATRPLGMLEKRMREYLDNTDSNASVSSDETYKQNVTKQESEAQTSPSGPVSNEVTSTKPDDAVSVDQRTNESPSLSPEDSTTTKEDSPKTQSPEVPNEQSNQAQDIKEEMDTDNNYRYDSFARSYESALILSTLATANRPVFGLVDPKSFTNDQAYANAMFLNNNNIPEQNSKALGTNMFIPQQQQEQMFAEDLRNHQYPSSTEAAQNYANRAGAGATKDMSEGSWDKPVLCKVCGRALKSEKMLDIHMNTAHTHKTIYPCKQCGKVFYAASSLHSHKKRTHTSMEQKYKCPHCDRFYAFQSELLRHIDTAHMELVSMGASQVGMGSDVAAFWAAYREHPLMGVDATQQQQRGSPHSPSSSTQKVMPLSQAPQIQPPNTPESQRQSPLQNTLANLSHDRTSPFTPISLPGDVKPGSNSMEDTKLDISNNINNNNIHDDGKDQEKYTVSSAGGLRYKCNICGMLLKSKECLSLHINAKHTQKQAYPCNVCGKVFYAPSSRFCHIRRVHASTEQKFHCDYCDKIFTFHYELRNHLKLMHRNKMIQRSDGSISENEPSNGELPEESSDVQDLSNGTTSPASIANSSDQG